MRGRRRLCGTDRGVNGIIEQFQQFGAARLAAMLAVTLGARRLLRLRHAEDVPAGDERAVLGSVAAGCQRDPEGSRHARRQIRAAQRRPDRAGRQGRCAAPAARPRQQGHPGRRRRRLRDLRQGRCLLLDQLRSEHQPSARAGGRALAHHPLDRPRAGGPRPSRHPGEAPVRARSRAAARLDRAQARRRARRGRRSGPCAISSPRPWTG